MAIKIGITLEGVEDVKSGIDDVVKHGENASTTLSGIGKGIDLSNLKVQFGNTSTAIEGTSTSVKGFTEAIHLLRPVLEEAGVSLGNMRELAVLARIGIEGLAVALAAGALIALAKLADQAAVTKGKLSDLLGSTAAGGTAFGKLEADAAKLGTTVEQLVPTFTTLQRVLTDTSSIHFFAAPGQELPSFLSNASKAEQAAIDLFAVLRFGRASFDEATKASQDFASGLEKTGGKITSALLIPIRNQFPAAFDAIKTALGGAGATVTKFFADLDKHPKTLDQLDGAFQQLGKQIPATFDPKAPQGFSDALTIMGNQIKAALAIQQPKAFEEALAKLGPAVAAFVAEVVKISPHVFEFLAADLTKLKDAIEATFVDVKNLTIILAAGKEVITAFFTAPPAAFNAALKNLQDVFAEIGRTGAAPGVGTGALKQAFDDAAKSAGGIGAAVGSAETKTVAAGSAVNAYTGAWSAANQTVQNVAKSVDQVAKEQSSVKFVTPPLPGTDPFAKGAAPTIAPAEQAVTALQQAKTQIAQIWSEIVATIKPEEIAAALDPLAFDLPAPFEIAADVIDGVFAGIVRSAQQMAADIAAAVQQALGALQQLQQQGSGGGAGSVPIPLAGGGLIRGPGTATSDSIWARLSNLEYVMRAAAVQFYGVDFMHALNAMRLPKDLFRGFSFGGLVPTGFTQSGMAFAVGGLVKALAGNATPRTPVILNIDRRSFALSATDEVVRSLELFAVHEQLSAGGRKPGWSRS